MRKQVIKKLNEINKKYKTALELTEEKWWCNPADAKYCIINVDKENNGTYTNVVFAANTLKAIYENMEYIEDLMLY